MCIDVILKISGIFRQHEIFWTQALSNMDLIYAGGNLAQHTQAKNKLKEAYLSAVYLLGLNR